MKITPGGPVPYRPYRRARRSFLAALGGSCATIGLGAWLGSVESHAQGAPTPRRLMVIHRPNGTIRRHWLPQGAGSQAVLGSILQPFAGLSQRMIVIDGLRIVPSRPAADHEAGMVTLCTGEPFGDARDGRDDYVNTAPSVDQRLLATSPLLGNVPFPSLQVAAHDGLESSARTIADRVLSYAGPDQPLFPELKPRLLYGRIFGALMAGGATPQNQAMLQDARARQQSVLDFIRADLKRLRAVAPASARERFDAHESAIRGLEVGLDQSHAALAGCSAEAAAVGADVEVRNFRDVATVGAQHLAIIRVVFACDLSRVVSYSWSPGVSGLVFEGIPEGTTDSFAHHPQTHGNLEDPDLQLRLAGVDRWYSEQTASFIQALESTPEADGTSLLSNTLILYVNEVAAGDHSYTNMPLVVFGGPGVGLRAPGIRAYEGRSTNDLWLSVARQFKVALPGLGHPDQYSGPLEGLLDDV